MRRQHDAYMTPWWQGKALTKRLQISGVVWEPCCGDRSLVRVICECPGVTDVVTNDVDVAREANFHLDATRHETWREMALEYRRPDWVVTNPPFKAAQPILRYALQAAIRGVVFLGRMSWLEPTTDRETLWLTDPPTNLIVLPWWSYTGDGRTDSVTTAWHVWDKRPTCDPGRLVRAIDVVRRDEMG